MIQVHDIPAWYYHSLLELPAHLPLSFLLPGCFSASHACMRWGTLTATSSRPISCASPPAPSSSSTSDQPPSLARASSTAPASLLSRTINSPHLPPVASPLKRVVTSRGLLRLREMSAVNLRLTLVLTLIITLDQILALTLILTHSVFFIQIPVLPVAVPSTAI